jgi:SAM-dependent methyltransferase
MQDLPAERAFYDELFGCNPENEHIVGGYDEIHALALPEAPRGRVLDMGCGTGAHALLLARRGVNVVAMELSLAGVRATRARLQREGLEAGYVVADAQYAPFRDGAVAIAWTSLLLHHFPRLNGLPAELARVTQDRVIAFEPNAQNGLTWLANNVLNRWWGIPAMTPNQRALWPRRLRRVFERHGFREVALHYVNRNWDDKLRWVRRVYGVLTAWLPTRFRANKFLIVFEKRRT